MKKGLLITLAVILVVGLLIGGSVVGKYNSLVTFRENVDEKWAQVENVYQRRADLIPNLVSTVKGYAAHETETFQAVVKARAAATQTTIDPSKLTSQAQIDAFTKAQGGLSSALSRLMVVVEKYPDLKANQNFLALQSQLEGTENRITVERKRFNEAARGYNTIIKRFPTNMLAGMFNFEAVAYFKSTLGAETAPIVEF